MRLSCKVRLFIRSWTWLSVCVCLGTAQSLTEAYKLTITAHCDVPCWWWVSRVWWEDTGVRTPVYTLHRGVVALHCQLTEWTSASLSKLGIEINDVIKEELFHQEATIKENSIESLHGMFDPWSQKVNLKILKKFLS